MGWRESKTAQRLDRLVFHLTWFSGVSQPLARVPWSSIRRIGQSRFIGLTIIVPFLGSLILFNQHVVDLFTLSSDVVGRWVTGDSVAKSAEQLTLSRLYFAHFGLSLLGIASAIFTMACPIEVKTYGSAREFVGSEAESSTPAQIAHLLPTLTAEYVSWDRDEDEIDGRHPRTLLLAAPFKFTTFCDRVIKQTFSDFEGDFEDHAGEDNDSLFYDHRGQPDSVKIARALTDHPHVLKPFVYEFEEAAAKPSNKSDILTAYYMALDNRLPWLRAFVVGLYGLGFFLLFCPTVETFGRILWSVARRTF